MLTNVHKYNGTNSIIIGNGSPLPITGIGNSSVKQKSNVLPLYDVLLVPNLKKNLLSVSQSPLNSLLIVNFLMLIFV